MIRLAATIAMAACAFAPAQGGILAVSWTGTTSLIDVATGVPTTLGPAGVGSLNSLARDPVSGAMFTVSGADLRTVNPATGASTYVVTLPVTDLRGLAFTPAGICYAIVNGSVDTLYTVNVSTGSVGLVGSTGNSSLQALAADSSGALFGWAVNPTGGGGTLMSINATTGLAAPIGPAPLSIQALAFSPTGVLYAANTSLYTLNPATTAFTLVGSGLGDVRGIEFQGGAQPDVSFSPAAQVAPGGIMYVLYSAPAHGGEVFVPVVSCTLGAFTAPFLPQPLGIAWDACTDFYFNDPAGLAVFGLSGVTGSFAGTLDAAGSASGWVFVPAGFPAGLNIPIHVTFVSWTAAYVTSVHGVGTFTLQ